MFLFNKFFNNYLLDFFSNNQFSLKKNDQNINYLFVQNTKFQINGSKYQC